MKIISKLLTLIITFTFLATVWNTRAESLSSGNDQVTLQQPTDQQIVTGQIQVNWFMKDPDQADIEYQLDMFTRSCPENGDFFGIIANGSRQTPSGGNVFSDSWNTAGPIKNKSTIADGEYCVRICPIFRRLPNNFYSFCDKHTVVIGNTNKPPKITSTPPSTGLNKGDSFSYQVKATDPDGDPINYKLESAPSFLQINSSGLISSKGAIAAAGSFPVKVTVNDGKGMKDSQTFTLNVKETQPSVTPTPTTTGTVRIDFVAPDTTTTFDKTGSTIKWKISGVVGIKSIALFYSIDATTFLDLAKPDATATEYKWDISKITQGKYVLKIQVTDSAGKIFEQISPIFQLNSDVVPTDEIPLISDLSPAEDAKISELRPTISVTVKPATGTEISKDKITAQLDAQTLSKCDYQDRSFKCTLDADLAAGRHSVLINAEDSKGKKAVREWQFEILADATGNGSGGNVVSIFGRNIPSDTFALALGILCFGLLLLIVPWLIYTLLLKKRREQVYQEPSPIMPEAYIIPPEQQVYEYPIPDQNIIIQSPQVVAAPPPPAPETFSYEPSIGSQSLGEPQAYVDASPIPSSAPPPPVEVPQIYTDNAGIPDWLKENPDNSQPVGPGGSNFQVKSAEENALSNPYDDNGMASNTGDPNNFS